MAGTYTDTCSLKSYLLIYICIVVSLSVAYIMTKGPQEQTEKNWSHGILLSEKVDDSEHQNVDDGLNKLSSSSVEVIRAKFLTSEGYMDNALVDFTEDDIEVDENTQTDQPGDNSSGLWNEDWQHIAPAPFTSCDRNFRDWTPSMNNVLSGNVRQCMIHILCCYLPLPEDYGAPYKWPRSKNQVRRRNIPRVPVLNTVEADFELKVHGDIIFLSEKGLSFSTGVTNYVNYLIQLVPQIELGKKTRLVLDLASRYGDLGIELEKHGALTLAISSKLSPGNGVQLILERGYPGLLHDLATELLPYPNQAFDLLHCVDSDIPWFSKDGLLLLEADRILQEGGFFIWREGLETDTYNGSLRLEVPLCWKLLKNEHKIFVWQKLTNSTCQVQNHLRAFSPLYESNAVVGNCLIQPEEWGAQNWPQRLVHPPVRLQCIQSAGLVASKAELFEADTNFWRETTNFYLRTLGQSRVSDIRNVLDMNAGYGGFAAAVTLREPSVPWWILNVVPINGPNRLAVIFDRGLIGVYHDWCTSLGAYPRTFDMIHASRLFSPSHKCHIIDILLEMDRLLRPGGFALIRDDKEILRQIRIITNSLHWKSTLDDTESGPMGYDKVLHCQKTSWRPEFQKDG